MIKSKYGTIEVQGIKAEVRADFCTLVYSLFNDGILTKEELEEDLQRGLKTTDEADEYVEENIGILLEILKMRLNDME